MIGLMGCYGGKDKKDDASGSAVDPTGNTTAGSITPDVSAATLEDAEWLCGSIDAWKDRCGFVQATASVSNKVRECKTRTQQFTSYTSTALRAIASCFYDDDGCSTDDDCFYRYPAKQSTKPYERLGPGERLYAACLAYGVAAGECLREDHDCQSLRYFTEAVHEKFLACFDARACDDVKTCFGRTYQELFPGWP